MPITRTLDRRTAPSGGFTEAYWTRVYHGDPAHDGARSVGFVQTIESDYPKGTKLILLRDQVSGALYPRCNPVTIDKKSLTATPIDTQFWAYADGYMYRYVNPFGNSQLAWFVNERGSAGIQYPTQASKDRALTMALSRVAEAPFHGAADIGELKETFQFMKKPFGSLYDLMRGFRRKVEHDLESRKRQARRPRGLHWRPQSVVKVDEKKYATEAIADTWMEYRYAATPLVLSASNLAETAAQQVKDLISRVHSARGAHKDVSSTEEYRGHDWIYDGCPDYGARRAANVSRRTEVKAAYVIRYAYHPWMTDMIELARYGLSPTQLGSTIYELTRFSWLADWFWNFGHWLKAMEPKPQCTVLDVCFTHKFLSEVEVIDAGGTWSYYGPRLSAEPEVVSRFERAYMSRSIVTNNLTVPKPRLTADHVTLSRILDSVALLWRPAHNIARRYENKYFK